MVAPVIGIDLGTTNTVVAAVRDGRATAIADEHGQTLIPSVVSFHPNGSVLVGRAAKERRLVDASNTVYSIKRLIGRSWDTEEVRRARTRFAFQMREGPGQATLVVGRGETYTLPEISAFVLRRAKQVAEAALGEKVERAVITVPANFNDLQRAATKVAGRVAGLEVLRILNEPTAAALAYGYGKTTSERLAVYDFGGGTFDVTLLDLSDNVFEVLATSGNTFLGGDDIDLAIAERIATEFLAKYRYDPRSNPQSFERLRVAAEQIKQRLSFDQEAEVTISDVAHGAGGKALDFAYRLTRSELERLIVPILDRTFDVCQEALGIARLTPRDFDQVLLVGGSTRTPLVKKRAEAFFGHEVRSNLSPDEVVALGAAIQANALTGIERRRGTIPPAPAALRKQPATAPRSSLGSAPGVAPPPSTQSFGEPRPAGALPALGALAGPRERPPLGTQTLEGLGVRGKIRTGPGLGPDAAGATGAAPPPGRSTLLSADEEAELAAHALFDAPHEEPTVRRAGPPKVHEESAAFTLGDHDIEEITAVGRSQADVAAAFDDAELTSPGELDLDENEPTRVPPAAPSAPMSRSGAVRTAVGLGPAADIAATVGATRTVGMGSPEGEPLAVPTAPLSAFARPAQALPNAMVPPPAPEPRAPLLIDVTPLTLSVETVRGYCDPIIQRNTPVPCEETRNFVTASDQQTVVRVRVAQGESKRFEQNTLLGEVELPGLPKAPRGTLQISVTFALDAGGMLNVSAKETASGRIVQAQLRLVGLPESDEVGAMALRHEQRQTA
jgi:molecular chaperone DnaK